MAGRTVVHLEFIELKNCNYSYIDHPGTKREQAVVVKNEVTSSTYSASLVNTELNGEKRNSAA